MTRSPIPFFVAWDSTIPRIRTVLEHAVEFHTSPDHRFLAVGYDATAPSLGDLRSLVTQTIHKAQAIIAVVDQPNATVGWEIGYALSRELPLGLIRASNKELPEWTRFGLLRGQLSTPGVVSLDRLVKVANQRELFTQAPARPSPGSRTLLLCADADERDLVAGRLPALEPLDLSTTPLADLPKALAGTGRAVWVIPDPDPDQVRDGDLNGLFGIAAGFLEGCGIPVTLIRHEKARDQQHFRSARTYSSLKGLLEELREWEERIRLGPGGGPPAPPEPLEAWLKDIRHQHRDLLPFVSETVSHDLVRQQPVQLALDTDARSHCLPEDGLAEHLSPSHRAGPRISLRALIEQGLRQAQSAGHAGRWLILAEPGAGKTTLARQLCRELAEEEPAGAVPVYVPVHVPLAERCRQGPRHPFAWAGEALHADDARVGAAALEAGLFEAAMENGRVWLLLDGLDEVPADKLAEVRRRIGT